MSRPIIEKTFGWSSELVDVEVEGETITSTASHPYWEDRTREWLRAGDLRAGMVLRLADGRASAIQSVSSRESVVEVYNFEVEGAHNYFVGASGALVHNPPPLVPLDDYNQALNAALGWLEPYGFRADLPKIARVGPNVGKPIGMMTADGKVGFRVEWDTRVGAHINVWNHHLPKGTSTPHFTFPATEKTVNKLIKQFACP